MLYFIYVDLTFVITTLFTELKNILKFLRYGRLKLIFKYRFAFHFRTNYDFTDEQPIIIFRASAIISAKKSCMIMKLGMYLELTNICIKMYENEEKISNIFLLFLLF